MLGQTPTRCLYLVRLYIQHGRLSISQSRNLLLTPVSTVYHSTTRSSAESALYLLGMQHAMLAVSPYRVSRLERKFGIHKMSPRTKIGQHQVATEFFMISLPLYEETEQSCTCRCLLRASVDWKFALSNEPLISGTHL